jgi:hypothetical protein
VSRRNVFIISAIVVMLFAGLVYYGWTYRWGAPTEVSIEEPPALVLPRRASTLNLEPGDFDHGVWEELPALSVPLLHQVSSPPHGKHLVPEVHVRAFHDGKNIFFPPGLGR